MPDQGLFACNQEKTEKYLLGPTLIEGNQLTSAVAGIPQNNVNWVVNLEFNPQGAAAFETATRELSQKSSLRAHPGWFGPVGQRANTRWSR